MITGITIFTLISTNTSVKVFESLYIINISIDRLYQQGLHLPNLIALTYCKIFDFTFESFLIIIAFVIVVIINIIIISDMSPVRCYCYTLHRAL